ncbi:lactonase family protein [Vibrio atypicus]|uniref:lactonase family protein n=1 Tax=Vibrio atypicus TaxID=558271 RepID=UPI0013572976|nr:lactonase family protein [Vibrio atypicus]
MQASGHLHFYVGTYTDSPSQSRGIVKVSLNQQTGELIRLDDVYPLRNPSYLTLTSQAIYSFSEVAQQEGAQLVCLQNQSAFSLPIAGDYPCHLDVSPDGNYLAVANYGSGNVSVYSLDNQGVPVSQVANLVEEGKGPNQNRQQSPHAHQVVFQTTQPRLVSVDLGSDAVRFYDIVEGEFNRVQTVAIPAGSGPRHLVFNRAEDTAYVVCELSETLVVLSLLNGEWQVTQQVDLLPESEKGEAASAIKLSADERFIYVSCRHQNRLSCFDVSGPQVQWLRATSSGGQFPRDFTVSKCGEWLIAANQHSNDLTSFRRDPTTGSLEATGYRCSVDAPVCVVEPL